MAAKAISLRQLAFREVTNGKMSADEALELLEREHREEVSRTKWQAVWTWMTVAAIGVVLLFACAARAQPVAAAAEPSTSIHISWIILVLAVLSVGLQFYRSQLEPKVDAKLAAIAADTKQSQVVRTLAHVGADLDPIITSTVGHMLNDVSAGAAAGQTASSIASAAAADVSALLDPALKKEAVQLLGPAGGAFADFIEGLIHDKVQAAAAAGNAAAMKITTPAAAVAAMNVAVPVKTA